MPSSISRRQGVPRRLSIGTAGAAPAAMETVNEMEAEGELESFAFDRKGLVPVSPLVALSLTRTKDGKAFLRRTVRRYAGGSHSREPAPPLAQRRRWSCAVYAVPGPLRSSCPENELWVVEDPRGRLLLLFPSERPLVERWLGA